MDFERQAQLEAEGLSRRVLFHDIVRRLRGEPNDLLPFRVVHSLRPKGESYKGLHPIEVDKIIGSVDRYGDFDAHFLPKEPYTVERWTRLRTAQLEGSEFPPIEVYKVGDIYFVKDGNHRTALAKAANQHYIDAYVIELEVPVGLNIDDTLKDLILKSEYAYFLEYTKLSRIYPNLEPIEFTKAGRYDVLVQHICTHQYFMGINQKRSITWEEAVTDWYSGFYHPTIQELRESGVLEEFAGRTEADLYLWISDHRYYLSTTMGHDIGAQEAVKGVYNAVEKPWYKKIIDWFYEILHKQSAQPN
jgi:hypothetical protein